MSELDDLVRRANDELGAVDVAVRPFRPPSRRPLALAGVAAAAAVVVAVAVIATRDRDDLIVRSPSTTAASTTAPTPVTASSAAPSTTNPISTTTVPLPPDTPPELTIGAGWEALPDPGLSPRYNALVMALGNRLVVMGGLSNLATPESAELVDGRLLKQDGTGWSAIAEAPVPIAASNAAAWSGSKLYVLAEDGSFISFDPDTNSWATLPKPDLAPRSYASATWHGDSFYVWGGYSPDRNSDGGSDPRLDGAVFAVSAGEWQPMTRPEAVSELEPPIAQDGEVANDRWFFRNGAAPSGGNWFLWYDFDADAWEYGGRPGVSTLPIVIAGELFAFDLYGPFLKWTDKGFVEFDDPGPSLDIGGNSIGGMWRVDGRLVGDTGSGGTNGRAVVFREEGGAWKNLGWPVTSNRDAFPVQLADGRLIGTDATTASVLRPIVDRTVGVRDCVGADFEPSVRDNLVLLRNRSSSACRVSGAPATRSEVRLAGRWIPTDPGTDGLRAIPTSLDGGFVGPGEFAAIRYYLTCQPGGAYADALRFGVGDSTLTVETAVPSCLILNGITGAPAST